MKILEMFYSIMGEVNPWGQGIPAIFIRFAGCNLNCPYCDSPNAKDEDNGVPVSVSTLLRSIKQFTASHGYLTGVAPVICITGGEPLIQPIEGLTLLIENLITAGYRITIETNGTKSISFLNAIHHREQSLSVIMDCKLNTQVPGGTLIIHPETFQILYPIDWVKIVVGSQTEVNLAIKVKRELIEKHKCMARFAISPETATIGKIGSIPMFKYSPTSILKDLINNGENGMVINIQLHKFLGLE